MDNNKSEPKKSKDPRKFGNKTAETVAVDFKRKKISNQLHHIGQGNQKRFEAPENTWRDIDAIYESAAYAIAESAQSVREALGTIGVGSFADHPNELTVAINGFSRDIEQFTVQLLKIKEKHNGKSGTIADEDYGMSLKIADEYMGFTADFQSTVLPAILVIMEQVTAAYNNMMKNVPNAKEIEQKLSEIDNGKSAPVEIPVTSDEAIAANESPVSDTPVEPAQS